MLNNFTVNFVEHSEVSSTLLNDIISLKQQHWPHSYNSQLDWINKNLNSNDYHLLLMNNEGELLGYMNLVHRIVNGNPVLGVGNVCINNVVLNKGIGTLLMQISKYYSNQLLLDLVLLCKIELVPFYKKCGFYQYHKKVFMEEKVFDRCIMFSNDSYNLENSITIDRNF
ncbi:GNAT family N-acetyltransferase [Metabacillus halosaccharovorans]|uniref:GNAT family N-acetyltransferase n=1 Tax=Metabacillus halosaccharovorans TaxID=930124 RepID=A0ABT3DED6_9BACI|nr:GNAT family N-acetyltransferase [Metabacillus halosaccharovorans]MCV9885435.1 GNAT family N-acetyltransferase [Metabacillus halosaccharovorans]